MKIRKLFFGGDTQEIAAAAAQGPTPLEEAEPRERERLVYRHILLGQAGASVFFF